MVCRNRGSLTGTLPTMQPIMQEAETDIFQGSRCRERISRSKRRYAHRPWSHQIFHGCLCVGTLWKSLSKGDKGVNWKKLQRSILSQTKRGEERSRSFLEVEQPPAENPPTSAKCPMQGIDCVHGAKVQIAVGSPQTFKSPLQLVHLTTQPASTRATNIKAPSDQSEPLNIQPFLRV